MADDQKPPRVIGEADPSQRLLTMPIVLGSGKPARISVTPDFDVFDLPYLMRAVLDIWMQLEQSRAKGKPEGGALELVRSLPPTRERN